MWTGAAGGNNNAWSTPTNWSTLNANQTFTATTANNTLLITSPIDLSGRRLTIWSRPS